MLRPYDLYEGGGLTDDLLVHVKGTGDIIEVRYTLSTDPYQSIAGIRFADGATWTLDDIINAAVGTPGIKVQGAISDDTLVGTTYNDSLNGGGGDDTLIGGAGDDFLWGAEGDDIFEGGSGSDILIGDNGSDTYRFSSGSGNDVINDFRDASATNAIVFDATVAVADIAVYFSQYGDLILRSTNSDDSITIGSAYADETAGIDEVRFNDGTIWTRDQLVAAAVALPGSVIQGDATDQTLTGTALDDSIDGDAGNETIIGGAGNDLLYGGDGADILIGGAGHDELDGGYGNDIYRFSAGFGSDTVYVTPYYADDTDVIEFDATIAAADVHLTFEGDGYPPSMLLTIDGSTDRIMLNGLHATSEIHFADGTIWTYDDMASLAAPWLGVSLEGDQGTDVLGTSGWDKLEANYGVASTLKGFAGDDVLNGSTGDDTLEGGAGDDEMQGNQGADTYRFSAGFGQDQIYEWGSDVNHIVFDSSISSSNIIIEHEAGYNGDITYADVILRVAGTENRITWGGGFGSADFDIAFADGTVWNSNDIRARWSLIEHPYQGGIPIVGGATNDTMYGSVDADVMEGGGGNDTLISSGGSDILLGGTGADQLYGGIGGDTYRFSAGFGEDWIYDSVNGADFNVIEFDATIDPAQVSVLSDASNLSGNYYLSIAGSEDRVWISRNAHDAVISQVRFANGTVWSAADIEARLTYSNRPTLLSSAGGAQLVGTAGSDTLTGTAAADDINGGGSVQWQPVGPNLIANGSFEQLAADASPQSWGYSATTLPGWTRINSTQPATTLGIEQITSGYNGVAATNGNYWLDLDGAGTGGTNVQIAQDVTGLTEGETLLVQFDHANRTWDWNGSFDVLWNGTVVASFNNNGTAMVRSSVLVTAAAGTNQLSFRGTGNQDGVGASLDNVSLTRTQAVARLGDRQRRAVRPRRRRSHPRRRRRRCDLRRQRQRHAERQWRQRHHQWRCRQRHPDRRQGQRQSGRRPRQRCLSLRGRRRPGHHHRRERNRPHRVRCRHRSRQRQGCAGRQFLDARRHVRQQRRSHHHQQRLGHRRQGDREIHLRRRHRLEFRRHRRAMEDADRGQRHHPRHRER